MGRGWTEQLADSLCLAKSPSPESFDDLMKQCAEVRLSVLKTATSSAPNPTLACSVMSLYISAIELAPTATIPTVPDAESLQTQSQMLNAVNELMAWYEADADAQSVATGDGTLDERAVAAKVAHPEWSDQQIATHIGCHRTSLFGPNMTKYKMAKAALKMGREKYRGDV